MAERYDVAGRLAEGVSAVEHTQSYVRASQLVGYEHPDLTAHLGQLRDWYDSEDGLDLRALDADCAQLRAAGTVAIEALRLQRAQLAGLATAWAGPGADAAVAFLQRHCDVATVLVDEVRAAAQRCESLRDNLWRLVDEKVTTVTRIDDSTLAQRPVWLAAAAAVTAGAGNLEAARQVVVEQVKPYVDNVVRGEWVVAMRSARSGVDACYDMVVDRMAAAVPVYFELPGDLGPTSSARRPDAPRPASAAPAISTMGPVPATAASAPAAVPPAPNPAVAQPDSGTTPGGGGEPSGLGELGGMGGPAGLGELGGMSGPAGLGELGGMSGLGGIGAVVSGIIEELGGLLSSGLGELDEASAPIDPADSADTPEEDAELQHESEPRHEVQEPAAVQALASPGAAATAAEPQGSSPPTPAGQPTAAQPAATPPPASAPQTTEPPPRGSTPCEIAADELPQAGQ
ncbi:MULTISPECIES: hypothetical protein [Mycobacterium]|uniref:Uncharacterized protein n=1 Tax=Mycobacterium kiyosense TaxID=2871094 RepID=A0A9P3QC25_9MYCO|nr:MULTISPECIES: hypothetical protein [Mycobacterium]BDB40659.1 hypothetical protein IWGMT90018_11050 [Mycobacterium kiyosense]BDE12470.1 hypothetical protein MKCMC460_13300 [Mycobacterium sp. 20KCMC460]GLB85006.1 hypothetical protein SRL2020028_42620 [Mycobacterium kiyosense]GLB89796.1 hypothetical protein SRL2020130_26130 [Mycobacterium kiyosense]GLB97803.1 hypothetical protein SRL2020226_45790 [Mycobacterium kiyosense]